jgi:hypothetical protein
MLFRGEVGLMKGPGVISPGLTVGLEEQHAQFGALLSQA